MDLIDEIAHRHNERANRVTDFYMVESDHTLGTTRYKVVETASPTLIVGGEVMEFRFDYVVLVWRQVGWVEVLRASQDHAETPIVAARIAHNILTS